MNPATGRPAEGLLSATVIARSATVADGLSTTLFAPGPEAAAALLRDHYRNVEAVLVLPGTGKVEARVVATPGLRGDLELRAEYRGRYSLEFLDFAACRRRRRQRRQRLAQHAAAAVHLARRLGPLPARIARRSSSRFIPARSRPRVRNAPGGRIITSIGG